MQLGWWPAARARNWLLSDLLRFIYRLVKKSYKTAALTFSICAKWCLSAHRKAWGTRRRAGWCEFILSVFVCLIGIIVICRILHYSEVAIIHYIDNVSIRAAIHPFIYRNCIYCDRFERNFKFIIHIFIFFIFYVVRCIPRSYPMTNHAHYCR